MAAPGIHARAGLVMGLPRACILGGLDRCDRMDRGCGRVDRVIAWIAGAIARIAWIARMRSARREIAADQSAMSQSRIAPFSSRG